MFKSMSRGSTWIVTALAGWLVVGGLAATLNAAGATPDEVFKQKGLTRSGFLLISDEEAKLHATVASVRTLKSRVGYENGQRASMTRRVQIAEDLVNELNHQMESAQAEMNRLKDNPREFNARVAPYNAKLAELKRRAAEATELRKSLKNVPNSTATCDEAEIAAVDQADAVTATYAKLAQDPALTAAIAQYNTAAAEKVRLGPSGACIADQAFLKKCLTDMAAEGIPVSTLGGVPALEVHINGKSGLMIWDSGASSILLSSESAAEMNLEIPNDAPAVHTKTADGQIITCRLIMIPQVRVGPYVAHDVEALVSPKGIKRGEDLIGGSFQRNFQCRLDMEAHVLHLTPNPQAPSAPITKTTTAVAAANNPFGAKGLTVAGKQVVAAQEPEIHKAVMALHGLKVKVASEANARAAMSRAVEETADAFTKLATQLQQLRTGLDESRKDPDKYNGLLNDFNDTLKQTKIKRAKLFELRAKLGKMEDSQSGLTESALGWARLVDAVQALYPKWASDPAIKAEIDKYNKANPTAVVTLGPSATFAADAAFLKQLVAEIEADGIPFRIEGGVPTVEVTINGKSVEMIWDSGATFVSLSSQTAAELGIRASDKDEIVKVSAADGKESECRLVTVASIRVGGYTATNVQCAIAPPGDTRTPDLLGGTFQSRFLCRLDRKAGVLHLTPNTQNPPARKTAAGGR